MSFNGSGVFLRLYNWVNDAAANIKIRADRMDAEFNGIATGLTNCITKDGQTTVTANLPMAGFKHTGVGNASASNEYAAYGQLTTALAAITLDSLSDVVLTSTASGNFIYYNGTNWVNVAKDVIPVDGLKATGSGGISLKNSAGSTVAIFGVSSGTSSSFLGDIGATGYVNISGTSSSPAYITLAEDTDNGTNKVTLSAPAAITSDYTVTMPSTSGTLLVDQFLHLQDQKTSGTAGGTFTSGAWQTRTLNTELTDTIGSTLASNQFTLPAGTYYVEAICPTLNTNSSQARLQNITDAATTLLGISSVTGTTAGGYAFVDGQFTITGTKTFELQHRCSTTKATDGFGYPSSWGTEVYAEVRVWKVV